MCCSRIFIRSAGMRHSAFSRSISGHCALRNSPGRTKTKRRKPQRAFRREEAFVGIYRPEQCADALRFDDRGVVLFFRWRQGAAQIAGRIALRPAGRHGVAEHLPAVLHRPMRGFQRAPALNPAQHGQEFGRFDFGNGPLAEPREHIHFEPPQNAVTVTRHPSRRELGVPLAGDGLETLRAGLRELLRLARFARIDAGRNLLAGSIASSLAPLSGSRRDRRQTKAAFPCHRSDISSATTCRQRG